VAKKKIIECKQTPKNRNNNEEATIWEFSLPADTPSFDCFSPEFMNQSPGYVIFIK
jgi:hypothetical protein